MARSTYMLCVWYCLSCMYVCMYGFLLCFWRQQVTVHMHKKRYMCVIHSWCVWVVIHVCCTLIEMCLLVYPVNLCVHICVQRMFWFTSICAYKMEGVLYSCMHTLKACICRRILLFMWYVHISMCVCCVHYVCICMSAWERLNIYISVSSSYSRYSTKIIYIHIHIQIYIYIFLGTKNMKRNSDW